MAYGIDLTNAVNDILRQYSDDVAEVAAEALEDVTKAATKKLKAESPKRTGKYAKGWTYEIKKGRVLNSSTIYGRKNTYPLAHLLEHGHAKRNGGRVAPVEHIKPVEDWAVRELESKIVRKLGGIT